MVKDKKTMKKKAKRVKTVNSTFQKTMMKQQARLISLKEQVDRKNQEENGIAKLLSNSTVTLGLTLWIDCINLMMEIRHSCKEFHHYLR